MGRRLITVDEVRDRMGIPDLPGLNAIFDDTIQGVTDTLESDLGVDTLLLTTGIVETFFVPESQLVAGRWSCRLYLENGFVTETPTPYTVFYAPRIQTIIDGDGTDLRQVATPGLEDQYVLMDLEKGILTIHDISMSGMYVQVTYDSGLPESPVVAKEDLEFDPLFVPKWLKELAYLSTAIILESHPTIRTDKDRPSNLEQLSARYEQLLGRKTRYVPEAIYSILY